MYTHNNSQPQFTVHLTINRKTNFFFSFSVGKRSERDDEKEVHKILNPVNGSVFVFIYSNEREMKIICIHKYYTMYNILFTFSILHRILYCIDDVRLQLILVYHCIWYIFWLNKKTTQKIKQKKKKKWNVLPAPFIPVNIWKKRTWFGMK